MKRKLHRDDREGGKEVNPMEGVANLADVMLVLAVGMMLAPVVAWNVDICPICGRSSRSPRQTTTTRRCGTLRQFEQTTYLD